MKRLWNFLGSVFLSPRLFIAGSLFVLAFTLSYFFPWMVAATRLIFYVFVVCTVVDFILLFSSKGIDAQRSVPEFFSNGDKNPISILISSSYTFPTTVLIYDDVPPKFQIRDSCITTSLSPNSSKKIEYFLRPNERGTYHFGKTHVFVRSFLGIIERRFRFDSDDKAKVYPSIIQMKHYELLAVSNRLQQVGMRKMKKVGQTMEFDQIREYVRGDDVRTINWSATARKTSLMINQYQDERSQDVYSIIDMGRLMRSPFNELTLLDYSINASLALSNIVHLKQDKPGLITYSKKVKTIVRAERKSTQMLRILEALYSQTTDFAESNTESLYRAVRATVKQRSLLLYFTNIESLISLNRQLHFYKQLAKHHLLCVIFFENSELKQLTSMTARNVEQVYIKTIAEKIEFEKSEIAATLEHHGILSIVTAPEQLTLKTINKYLEIKTRAMI